MKQLQTERLQEQLKEVLEQPFSMSLQWNEEKEKVTGAKFNTREHLTKEKLQKLEYIGERWDMHDYEINRSGTGLTYEFKTMAMEPAAAG